MKMNISLSDSKTLYLYFEESHAGKIETVFVTFDLNKQTSGPRRAQLALKCMSQAGTGALTYVYSIAFGTTTDLFTEINSGSTITVWIRWAAQASSVVADSTTDESS
jgi:hypothetical protein